MTATPAERTLAEVLVVMVRKMAELPRGQS